MICNVAKKGLLGAGVGALALGLMFGTPAPSYVRAYLSQFRKSVQASVPVDVQIERARQEIASLEPAIMQGIESLAKAETEVKYLKLEIANHRQNLDVQQRELVALRGQLDSGYRRTDGSDRSRHLEAAAARRLDQYKHGKALLTQKDEVLEQKQKSVEAAKATLEKTMDQKKLLAVKVEQIETRLKQIQATKASNEFSFDDTALSRAKASITDLEKRLDQMERVAEYEGQLVDRDLPIAIEQSRDVAREIDEELHRAPADSGDKPL